MTRASLVVAALAVVLGLAGPAGAQQRVLLLGNVQWTTGNRVQMITDTGVAVNVDASRLDQSSYTSLRAGDRVRIVGTISPDRRVTAEILEVDTAGLLQTP